MLITKATGIAATRVRTSRGMENGAMLLVTMEARQTSADTTRAMRKASQLDRFVPCFGCVLVIAVTMIPASPGPQVATATTGNRNTMPLFSTAL